MLELHIVQLVTICDVGPPGRAQRELQQVGLRQGQRGEGGGQREEV